jgi:pimeloyl-ACP methyl ester carboxylesterase
LEERMPDCSLVVIEDAGHWPFVEKPKEVLTALEVFLEKLN